MERDVTPEAEDGRNGDGMDGGGSFLLSAVAAGPPDMKAFSSSLQGQTKYGRCPRCGVAMRLHLIRSSGELWTRRSNFWKFKEDNKTRKCWQGRPYNGPAQKRMKSDMGWQTKRAS